MKLFLDSLDTENISKYSKMCIIQGVTTNPTLAKRFNMSDDIDMIKKVNEASGGGEIHVEAFGDTEEEIISNAERIIESCQEINVIFKIPFSEEGVAAANILEKKGMKTNLHLIFSINQALLSAKVGATYICPLVGRLDDIGYDAIKNVQDIKSAFKLNEESTQVMVSSVRHPQHVIRAYKSGADAVTVPLNVLSQMFRHPLTDYGINSFKQDIELLKPIGSKNINKNLVVQENDTLQTVLSVLASYKGGAVAVCSEHNLKGIFTTGDLKRLIKKGKKSFNLNDPVSKYMTENPIAFDISEQTIKAVELIKKHDIEQLIVVDNGVVVGILDIKEMI